MLDGKTRKKEEASSEKHHWVRLTKRCNNNCVFCLDTGSRDGSVVPFDTLAADFRRGRADGATRLILSGGEATLHPDFIPLVRFASSLGFRRIQVVTNGRMFAYRDFLDCAIDAGLQETTFSMHGHTPELHDAQTRVPGSFLQALAGLSAALQSRRLIVNVDIVINKFNYRSIDEIMDFFIGLGIREFDLLHVTPYGDAWKNRADVFYDPARGLKYLNRAFAYSRRPDLFVWTNRFPPQLLSAFPELIQNPLKIKDEVRGRMPLFDDFLAGRARLPCRGARCHHCFLRGLCSDLFRIRRALDSGGPSALSVHTADLGNAHSLFGPRLKKLALLGGPVSELKTKGKLIPDGVSLFLFFDDFSGFGSLGGKILNRNISAFAADPLGLENILSAGAARPLLELNTATADFIASGRDFLEKHKVVLFYRNRKTLTECREKDVDLKDFFSGGGFGKLKTMNLPACLPHGGASRLPRFVPYEVAGPRGEIDMRKLADDFILNGYYVHPEKCGACAKKNTCPGLHVNCFRAFGFDAEPFRQNKGKRR